MLGKTTKTPEKRGDRGPIEADDDTSVISMDMRIIGDCSTNGRLRIHGKISGNVTARAVELTSTGSVKGDIAGSEGSDGDHAFVINGTVEGTVRATRVEIQRNGVVTGGVVADDVVVQGRVEGGILARNRLALDAAAAVEGDVRARRLALKEGGQVNGTILMGERAMTGISNENQAPEVSDPSPKESGLAATAPAELPADGPKRLAKDEGHASVRR